MELGLTVGIPLILLLLILFQRQRRAVRTRRREERRDRRYRATKRDLWLHRWLFGSRFKRLSDMRASHERTGDVSGL